MLFQGNDRSMVKFNGPVDDEIEQYMNLRCIGSLEACSRLFSIPQAERFPSVQQLTVHLAGQQSVLFEEGTEVTAASSALLQKTELTEFFAYNKQKPQTRVKYCDFPECFLWLKAERKWTERKIKTGTIGRVYTVHPSAGEKYYLRMLLHHDFCKGMRQNFLSTIKFQVCLS